MLVGFLLSLLAGLSTVIGGLIGIHPSLLKDRALALALGFSAGAMVYVSFMDLLPEGQISLEENFGNGAIWISSLAFLAGLAAVSLLEKLVHHKHLTMEAEEVLEENEKLNSKKSKKLLHSGIIVAITLAIHNFPEGIATLTGTMQSTALGVSLAIAIALHNIPEGIAIAAPIYAATKKRSKALLYTLASGLAEPIGAIFGYLLIMFVLPDNLMGIIFSMVAGMMVSISVNELMPTAKNCESSRKQSIIGFILGTTMMLISLNLLAIK